MSAPHQRSLWSTSLLYCATGSALRYAKLGHIGSDAPPRRTLVAGQRCDVRRVGESGAVNPATTINELTRGKRPTQRSLWSASLLYCATGSARYANIKTGFGVDLRSCAALLAGM